MKLSIIWKIDTKGGVLKSLSEGHPPFMSIFQNRNALLSSLLPGIWMKMNS